MINANFVKDVAERAIKTFLQTLAALIGASQFDWLATNWLEMLSTAGIAALASVFSSLASEPFGATHSASIVSQPLRSDLASESSEIATDTSDPEVAKRYKGYL